MVMRKSAREIGINRLRERYEMLNALREAEKCEDNDTLAVTLWSQREELAQKLSASLAREGALREACMAMHAKKAVLERAGDKATELEARLRAVEAERDAARAGEDAALVRLTVAESRVRVVEARLIELGTAPPRPALGRELKREQPPDAIAALHWLRQQRALSQETRYLQASRLAKSDGADVLRLTLEAQRTAPGRAYQAVMERLRLALAALKVVE